jgi:hypothetical protein
MIVDRVRYSSHRSHRRTPHHASAAGALFRRAGVAQHGMVVAVGRIVLLLLYTAVCWRGDAVVIPATTAAGVVQEPRVQRRGGGSGTRRLSAVLRVLIRIDAAGGCRRRGIGCRCTPRGQTLPRPAIGRHRSPTAAPAIGRQGTGMVGWPSPAITGGWNGGRRRGMVAVEAGRRAVMLLLGMGVAARIHFLGGELLLLLVMMMLMKGVVVVLLGSASSSPAAKLIFTSHLETGKPLAYAGRLTGAAERWWGGVQGQQRGEKDQRKCVKGLFTVLYIQILSL